MKFQISWLKKKIVQKFWNFEGEIKKISRIFEKYLITQYIKKIAIIEKEIYNDYIIMWNLKLMNWKCYRN